MIRASVLVALSCALVATGACGPRSVDVVMHQGIHAQRSGDADRAEARYRRAVEMDPKVDGAWNNLALLALEEGERTAAIRLLEEELARHPSSAEARLNRALLLVRMGEPADAAESLEDMANLDAGLPSKAPDVALREDRARVLLALARWSQGAEPDRVLEPVAATLRRPTPKAGRSEPDPRAAVLARARHVAGWQHARSGRWEAVVATWEGIPPGSDREARLLAWSLWKIDRPAEAIAALGSGDDDDSASRVLRAHLLVATGQHDRARRALDRDPAGTAEAPSAPARRMLASLEAAAGRWTAALDHLQAALDADPEPPPALWIAKAVALAHVGREEEARLVVAGVLRDAPDHAEARELHQLLR